MARVLRLFLAQADGFDLVFLDAQQGEGALDGFGALLAQRQVVFAAATFVGIALNQDLEALVGNQVFGMSSNQIAVFVLDIVLVQIEVDAALGQLALRIGQLARQAGSIDAASDDRGDARAVTGTASTGFDRCASAVFGNLGGGTGSQQGRE